MAFFCKVGIVHSNIQPSTCQNRNNIMYRYVLSSNGGCLDKTFHLGFLGLNCPNVFATKRGQIWVEIEVGVG
jgi:hypothetical protein